MNLTWSAIWLIITALAFGGVVEKAGVIERLITPVIKAAKSTGSLVASLVGAVLATNIVTADQYIAIVLPGRMFKNAFENRGFAPVVLSRTIGASGTPTGALNAASVLRRLGEIGTLVMMRLMAFILLCVGIQIIWTGWAELNGMKP